MRGNVSQPGEWGEHLLYISTACWHGLHDQCRNTCKYCSRSCACSHHPGVAQGTVSWVDQARDIARELLESAQPGSLLSMSPELLSRIKSDPALFWLRGEEQPPGEWQGRSG